MSKLLTLTEEQINTVLTKLTPSWVGCVDPKELAKAQESGATRNWLFGTILHTKFIKLTKGVAPFKAGDTVSIADIYEPQSAQSLAGLIIYRLAHNGLVKQPTVCGL